MGFSDFKDAWDELKAFLTPEGKLSTVRSLMLAAVIGFGLHVLWACGYGERWGIQGFVRHGDLTLLSAKMDSLAGTVSEHTGVLKSAEVRDLQNQIIQTATAECHTKHKSYFTDRMTKLTLQYYNLTNDPTFHPPACSDLDP